MSCRTELRTTRTDNWRREPLHPPCIGLIGSLRRLDLLVEPATHREPLASARGHDLVRDRDRVEEDESAALGQHVTHPLAAVLALVAQSASAARLQQGRCGRRSGALWRVDEVETLGVLSRVDEQRAREEIAACEVEGRRGRERLG